MKRFLFAVCILFCFNSQAETLLDVFEYSYKNNPKIAADLKKIQLNTYNKADARGAFLPTLDVFAQAEYDKSTTEISGNPAFAGKMESESKPFAYGANAEQALFAGGSNVANYNATSSSVKAQNEMLNYEIGGLLIEVAESYIDVLQTKKSVVFFTKSRDVLETNVKIAKLRFKNGTTPKTDLLRTEASFAATKADLSRAEGNYNIAVQKYISYVGKEPPANLTMPKILSKHVYKNFEEYYDDVLKFNPSLKAAGLSKDAADSSVNAARGKFLPKVVARASYSNSTNNTMMGMNMDNTDAKIGVYAVLPLFNRGLTANEMRKSLVNQEIAYLNEKSSLEDVALYAQNAWENWNTYREVKVAAEEKVKALSTAMTGVQLEAKIGRKSFVDVLQTQQEYIAAELELLNAEKQELISYLQMQQLVGKMTIKDLKDLKYD